MLSLFPSLFTWSFISPTLIRLTLAAVLITWTYSSLRKVAATPQDKIIGIVEGVAGLLLIIGLWTQAAALFVAVDLIVRIGGKIRAGKFLTQGVNYYLILLVLALSLLVTGAGFFAIDWPL